ncbi:MAG: NUDIX hydrolase [Pseudomonadota bacterium]
MKPQNLTDMIIDLGAVIVAVTDGRPLVLVRHGPALDAAEARSVARGFDVAGDALPSGPFDASRHRTLDRGLRETVTGRIGVTLGYVEQLYTFGDSGRHPREREGGPRVISVGYLALTHEAEMSAPDNAAWRSWYDYFPWEDWRQGRPPIIDKVIAPLLRDWIKADGKAVEQRQRQDRANICFALEGASWDEEIVLERYELLYEAGLVAEARREGAAGARLPELPPLGNVMMSDHRRILATAMGRLRAKLKYRPVVFDLMPESFSLYQLQRTVEAILGAPLHKQNFRRLVENSRVVESTGEIQLQQRGRPAALFRFRREVLRERLAAGVRISSPR